MLSGRTVRTGDAVRAAAGTAASASLKESPVASHTSSAPGANRAWDSRTAVAWRSEPHRRSIRWVAQALPGVSSAHSGSWMSKATGTMYSAGSTRKRVAGWPMPSSVFSTFHSGTYWAWPAEITGAHASPC